MSNYTYYKKKKQKNKNKVDKYKSDLPLRKRAQTK